MFLQAQDSKLLFIAAIFVVPKNNSKTLMKCFFECCNFGTPFDGGIN